MQGRTGQAALYLIMAILAVFLLVLADVAVFVNVRAKNKVMNAGDKAALEVAAWQMNCLNRIGELNIKHLKLVVSTKKSDPDDAVAEARERCAEIVLEQRRICLLDPLEGVRIGNNAAKKLGAGSSRNMRKVLERHLAEDIPKYRDTPDIYPPSWTAEEGSGEDAWTAYESRLRSVLAEDMYAGPDNVEFIDAAGVHLLLNRQFYNAVAGRAWCWFKFNAPGLLNSYTDFKYWSPLPSQTDDETRKTRCENSEVYPLHLKSRTQSALSLLGVDLIMHLTECSESDIEESALVADESQAWFFYDTCGAWSRWSTYDGYAGVAFNPENFPIDGTVKPEYDVKGAAAICRTVVTVENVDSITKIGGTRSEAEVSQYRTDWERLRTAGDMPLRQLGENGAELPPESPPRAHCICWQAGAKPFGTVTGLSGGISEVTVLNGFVTPAFSEVRLVPIDSVGALDLATADSDWMDHVRVHLPLYYSSGPLSLPLWCWYCRQLKDWERPFLRQEGVIYLKYNSADCVRATGGGGGRGGTPHGH